MVLRNLALMYEQQERLPDAEAAYRDALRIAVTAAGPELLWGDLLDSDVGRLSQARRTRSVHRE